MNKAKRFMKPILCAAALVLIVGGVVVLATRSWRPTAQHAVARYYCPMHPTYTSDRPGDCPICFMKLVKAEGDAPAAPTRTKSQDTHEHASEQFKTICYLHNCPQLHAGKPCPMTVVAKPGEAVTCPVCGMHIAEAAPPPGQRKVLYWTDPMIPGYQSDKPGTSPMGMELVPVYEEAAGAAPSQAEPPAGYAPVLVTPQKQQLIGMRTEPVSRRMLTKTIRTVGVVAHDPELYQAQQEFIQAQEAWRRAQSSSISEVTEQASRLVESSRLRLRHLGLSEEMIEDVASSIQPDHRLLLGGRGQFWVYASIYEYELSLIRPGQAVTVEVSALPGQAFTGTVKAIDPMLDAATRTARVRVLVEDPQSVLKPEMYVNVLIQIPLGEVLAVSQEAVFDTGTRRIAFVDRGQGLFEPRDVTLGAKADDAYEVTAGLAEGESVVTSGNFLIDSESRLKAAIQGLSSEGHQHGQ